MRIKSVTFKDYPPFADLRLDLSCQLTVIAGSNGVGKSRLLSALNQPHDGMAYSVEQDLKGVDVQSHHFSIVSFAPHRLFSDQNNHSGLLKYSMRHSSLSIFSGLGGFESWFASTSYHKSQGDLHSSQTDHNFELCKKVFNIVDSRFAFKRVDQEYRIVLNGPAGDVFFAQTSSGFQSAYILLSSIILLVDQQLGGMVFVDQFNGCILIDEVDLHLHPAWQGNILQKIQQVVPQAQIIATTHSPHVIQGLKVDELIALEVGEGGRPRVREITPAPGPYGFQGWTIEEILRDVMGIEDTLSEERQQVETAFNDALDDDDVVAAQAPYEKLMSMLHPKNPLRRVYDMQFRAMGGVSS